MDAAFVVVIEKQPAARSERWSFPSPSAVDLGLDAAHRLDWSSTSGTVHLSAWHQTPGRGEGAWHEDTADVTIVAGSVRWRGRPWEAPGRWAEDLATRSRLSSLDDLQDELRGVFAAAHLTTAGDGWLLTDVLGLRLLYWGEDDEVFVVSTRAALAAQALARSEQPPRDALSAVWLAFSGFRVGDETGYAAVRTAAPGARLVIRGGQARWEDPAPLVVPLDDDLRSLSVVDRAELVYEDIADALRAALSHPAERHIIRLTGGKDSRLILAVALRAGLADEFVYETVGPPDLADVRLAAELCDAFGLRHEARFLELVNAEPFAARFDRFVRATACMVNGWDLATYAPSPELRLAGLGGELLRRYRRIPEGAWTDAGVAAALPRSEFGRTDLLRVGLGDELHADLQRRLAHHPGLATDPLARLQALYAGARMRFTRMGAREELAGAHPMLPLYSRTTVRAAMSMDSPDRHAEILFAEIMRRASDVLVDHPFTDPGWDDRARAHLGRPAPPPQDAPPPVAKASSLIENLYVQADDRTQVLAELFERRDNPAWDHLDRDACLNALGRWSSLRTGHRYELFGAATAALWLDGAPVR